MAYLNPGAGEAREVSVTTPSDGDVPTYDAALGQYVPTAPSGGGGSGVVLLATTTLTDAEIKALPTTGKTLVAAPGAGKMLWWRASRVLIDARAGAYTNVNAAADLRVLSEAYSGRSIGTTVANSGYLAGQLAQTSNRSTTDLEPALVVDPPAGDIFASLLEWVDVPNLDNKPLLLDATNGGDGDFTGGHASNGATVYTLYAVLDLP